MRLADRRSDRCVVCGNELKTPILSLAQVPVFCNLLWSDELSAKSAPRGDIDLVLCEACGMITNTAFASGLLSYDPAYENSSWFAPTFARYAQDLARRLVDTYGIRHKTVVEIGAGSGDFLQILCAEGENRGLGFDPAYPGDNQAVDDRVTIVREPFSAANAPGGADLVCSRHVLEHLVDPRALFKEIVGALGERPAILYVEVPDMTYIVGRCVPWEIFYEHVHYFSDSSLARLAWDVGLEPLEVGPAFGDQFLALEARWPATATAPNEYRLADGWMEAVMRFSRNFGDTVGSWSRRVSDLIRQGRRVALWGAGSKGTTLLNIVPGAEHIEWVVDANPRKQGHFVPGTGQRIASVAELPQIRPEIVIATNPLYETEIRGQLAEQDIDAEVLIA